MRWPSRRDPGASQGESDELYPLATFLRQLRKLAPADAETVERIAEVVGIGTGSEWEMARRIMDRAASETDRSPDRVAGAIEASDAVRISPAGRRGYRLVEATAQLTGQALAIRQLLDRATWDFARSPWAGVASLPDWGQSGVGSAAEIGDRIRAQVQAEAAASTTPHVDQPRARTWATPFANPTHDPRVLLTVTHPWMSFSDAYELIDLFAYEVSRRKLENPSESLSVSPATMIDAAGLCRGTSVSEWRGIVRDRLDRLAAAGSNQ